MRCRAWPRQRWPVGDSIPRAFSACAAARKEIGPLRTPGWRNAHSRCARWAGARGLERVGQSRPQAQGVFARAGLDVLVPLLDGEAFARREGINVGALGGEPQSAAALLLRADAQVAYRLRGSRGVRPTGRSR